MPELAIQIPYIHTIKAFQPGVDRETGFEADDIIGTLARQPKTGST
jgi:hypothetical protein